MGCEPTRPVAPRLSEDEAAAPPLALLAPLLLLPKQEDCGSERMWGRVGWLSDKEHTEKEGGTAQSCCVQKVHTCSQRTSLVAAPNSL